ncbi:MAG: hypothetical protein RBS16_02390 [Candidatus Cloacimonadales bacterium]|jgi:hypothetical protein|nr:hypothetical protein [Candidatus Cloacimonadota bacterium]MDX9976860.1 hypothetical protein [Candidatus Cloacimonadales bacterium]
MDKKNMPLFTNTQGKIGFLKNYFHSFFKSASQSGFEGDYFFSQKSKKVNKRKISKKKLASNLPFLLLLFFISFTINIHAKTMNINETTEALWKNIKAPLDSLNSKIIYFDIVRSNTSEQLAFRLANLAFKDGYTVLDSKLEDTTIVGIMQDNKVVVEKNNYIIFIRENVYTYPHFLINISKNNQLIFSKNISFDDAISKKSKSSSRWYEPVMLATVLGSLVYLIYYGNH